MKTERVIIGSTDYTREEMMKGAWGLGTSSAEFLSTIAEYEKEGFQVKFETNIFRRIFAMGIYKVIAYRTYNISF